MGSYFSHTDLHYSSWKKKSVEAKIAFYSPYIIQFLINYLSYLHKDTQLCAALGSTSSLRFFVCSSLAPAKSVICLRLGYSLVAVLLLSLR